jgi:soluble lytic murein transglycosylase-like protein
MFKHIHPHARIWMATVVILGIFLVFNPRVQVLSHAPQGQVIAYYENEYQRHAIQRLTEQNKLEQYPCLYELWQRESNWRPAAYNRHGGASGIAQLKPSTWQNIKTSPTADGFKQVDAGLKYIDRHYGKSNGICKAYAHHLAVGWY